MSPKRKPRVISTFSGCGGSSLGYKLAGFDMRLACEWDDHAVMTYKANFPKTNVFHGDVSNLSVEQAMDMGGISGPRELELFDGSPPCQGFSMAGSRKDDDGRNQLFRQYVRLLDGLQPKAFVMENVKGMVVGKMLPIFRECITMLRGCGYKVKARVLNAKWYGVPQSRERVIFIGFRDDLGIEPSHPPPTFDTPITCSEALAGVEPDDTPELKDGYGRLWHRIQPGRSAASILFGTGYNSCNKLHPNKPAPTIAKMNSGGGFATMVHWAEPRAISAREFAVLSSFPPDFKWPTDKKSVRGRYAERSARIGNCVPPFFMREIASHVRREASL